LIAFGNPYPHRDLAKFTPFSARYPAELRLSTKITGYPINFAQPLQLVYITTKTIEKPPQTTPKQTYEPKNSYEPLKLL
jgi:hypothetical protein